MMMMNGKKKGTQLLSALSHIKLIYQVMRCIRHWAKIPERQLSIIWGCDWDLELCERKRSVEGGTGGGGGGVVEWWGSPDCPPKLQFGSVLFTEITLTERSEQSTTEWQTGTEVEPHQQARQPQSILIKQTSRDLYLFSFRECWQWNQRKVNYKIKSQKRRIGGGIKFKV